MHDFALLGQCGGGNPTPQTAQTPLAIPVIRSQIDAPIRDRQARGQRAIQTARGGRWNGRTATQPRPNSNTVQLSNRSANVRAAPAQGQTRDDARERLSRAPSLSLGPADYQKKCELGGGRTRTDSDSPPHSPTHRSNRTGGRQVHTAGLRIMPRCSERSSVATRSVTPPPCSLASGAAASR